ncbi:hypothetical protein BGZ61DRAFT_574437 [Ilyonectria robusta]|uniref:uncharacterized protein n=1 Tax=Ilyonectria robusta TaxID=1079257 RepID=UPI001E8DC575|nr:uncharacterized protein BGZ61DRAFT_574437 [Ilyonectria robusta]KAH8714490.1 hypothetical protein BGZ61DRAFT_574437 [Ilyonectria robusta]
MTGIAGPSQATEPNGTDYGESRWKKQYGGSLFVYSPMVSLGVLSWQSIHPSVYPSTYDFGSALCCPCTALRQGSVSARFHSHESHSEPDSWPPPNCVSSGSQRRRDDRFPASQHFGWRVDSRQVQACPIDGGIYSALGPHLTQCPCATFPHFTLLLAPCFPIPMLTLSPTHTHFWLPHTTTEDVHAHFYPHHHHPPSVPPIAGHPQQKKAPVNQLAAWYSARRSSTVRYHRRVPTAARPHQTGPTETRPPVSQDAPLLLDPSSVCAVGRERTNERSLAHSLRSHTTPAAVSTSVHHRPGTQPTS